MSFKEMIASVSTVIYTNPSTYMAEAEAGIKTMLDSPGNAKYVELITALTQGLLPVVAGMVKEEGGDSRQWSADVNQTAILRLLPVLAHILSKSGFGLSDEDKKIIPVGLQCLAAHGVLTPVITPSQYGRLGEWLRKAEQFVLLGKTIMPPPQLTWGESKGFLYEIKKGALTRGYLFGTMHHLIEELEERVPQFKAAQELHLAVQARLLECSFLGTEVVVSVKCPPAVEKKLVALARSSLILNFGLDDPQRGGLLKAVDVDQKEASKRVPRADDKALERQLVDLMQGMAQAYIAGDEEGLKKYHKASEKLREHLCGASESSASTEIHRGEEMRNAAMAQNIDACLRAVESDSSEGASAAAATPPKGFFAVGSAHLLDIDDHTETVTLKLQKRGWTIALVAL